MFDFLKRFFKRKENKEYVLTTNLPNIDFLNQIYEINKNLNNILSIDNSPNKAKKIVKPIIRTGVLGVGYYWKQYATGRKIVGFTVTYGRKYRKYFGFHTYGEEEAWRQAVLHRYSLENKTDYTIPKMPNFSKIK